MSDGKLERVAGYDKPARVGIELQRLVKTFRSRQGTVQAVRGVDISISRGETVALLGPNGAGKSTTIDMLLGLAEPDAGTVSVFGMPARDAVTAGEVGGMLQTGSLIRDLSVRELVSLVAALYAEPLDVDEVLAITGIEDIADRRTQKLSGGQTQRVRFAVAVVGDPELLVGTRVIRATLPDAELADLERLPGVTGAERHGEAVIVNCSDSDAAVRALLARYPDARDIEITGAGLEQAFLQLTAAQAAGRGD
jgi:predicted ABC-type transport system involved in lysophospholipase L1 biosynthesis ATPase subunit